MGEWTGLHIYGYRIICKCSASIFLHYSSLTHSMYKITLSVPPMSQLHFLSIVWLHTRLSKSHWRSVLTSLIVRAASVTTTRCVAGVLWRTSVLGGPSARMQWSQLDGCRTPASASQPQSPPTSLSWMTLRL